MKEVILNDINDFEKAVMKMEVDVRYMLPKHYPYESISIDIERDINMNHSGYSWWMNSNYNVSGHVHSAYPMKDSQYIKVFKTINGAKRNLIKRYKDYFERYNKKDN